MKVKSKIFIFALILSLIFSVTAVAAQENISFDQSELNAISNDLDIENSQEGSNTLCEVENQQLKNSNDGTFSDIQNMIDNADEGSTIFLNGKTYNGSSSINVNKQITIIGGTEGADDYATLDGQGRINIMNITKNNVVIRGIKFINGYAPQYRSYVGNVEGIVEVPTDGGAISISGLNCRVIDCNFLNNNATGNGGAISISGLNSSVINCNFLNNTANKYGGAIFIEGAAHNTNVENCNFTGNSAIEGTICADADDIKIVDSDFINNLASSAAGIQSNGKSLTVINGNFIGNYVSYDGGAIRFEGSNTIILNSKFRNNRAGRDGGTIFAGASYSTLKGNIFVYGYSTRNGGGIYIKDEEVVIEDNEFYFNKAENDGENIYILGTHNYILNNTFYDPTNTSMEIYENNPGSSIFENNQYCDKANNQYCDKAYKIEVNTTFTGFVGRTIQIPVYVEDYLYSMTGLVTLYGYGDHTLINGMAVFTITLPSTPSVFKSYIKYRDEIREIVIESVAHDSITSITQNNDSDEIIVKFPSGADGSVIVNIEGTNYFAEVINGTAVIKPKGLVNGQYGAIVLYSGDDDYSNEWKILTINITQSPVFKISENKDVSVKYTSKASYKVLIIKDGKAAGAGESVTFNFNGKNTVVKTDSQGYATLNLVTDVKVGTYNIKTTCNGVTTSNKVKVVQIIKASDKKVKKSASTNKIKISLDKVDGKYLSGKTIKIKFNGKTYNAKTNSKGQAAWNVKKSMLKNFKVGKKVKYTVAYGKDTLTKTLTIQK